MNRLAGLAACTVALLVAIAAPANAHAILEGSTPADGARVDSLDAIVLSLSERADPALSSIELLDADGSAVPIDPPQRGENDLELRATIVEPLTTGTYVVTWRAFSEVDGHLTAGAFVFGFGVEPSAIDVPAPDDPGVGALGVLGRALMLAGFALAFGASIVEHLSPLAVRTVPMLAAGGAAVALVGVAALGHQQRLDSGASAAVFLSSAIGRAVIWRAAGVFVALAGALAWRRWMRQRHVISPLVTAALAGVAIIHVANGHASDGGAVQIGLQVVHLLALSAWVGGFVPLIAAIRRGNARRVVTRFSAMALVLVPVVVVTGQVRAFDELDRVADFWSTSYGWTIIAKWTVLLAILAFAARNRSRHVARVADDPDPLVRSVRAEATLGIVVIALAGLLANLSPRSAADAAERPDQISVTRTSFAGDLEATLVVNPGTAGANEVALNLVSLPMREPIDDATVQLRLRYRGRPGIEPRDVVLDASGEPGSFIGEAILTPPGPYEATLIVQTASRSTEVILPFATFTEQAVTELGGDPAVTSITFEDGSSLQCYLDPEAVGRSDVHATFFDADGTERRVRDTVVVASGPEGVRPLVVRSLSPGHVVADAFLGAGRWRFDVSAIAQDGTLLAAWFERDLA